MIPVNPTSMLLGALLLLLSMICVPGLLGLLGASLHPRARAFMLARRKRFGFLALFFLVGSVPTLQLLIWQLQSSYETRALGQRLESEQVLGELVLPAGTQVKLARLKPAKDFRGDPLPHGLPSLQHAEFTKQPGKVRGMPVRSLYLDDMRASVRLAEDARLDGWLCSSTENVTFSYPLGARFKPADWQLHSCSLAAGSEVADVVWPKAITVQALENGRWKMEPGHAPIHFQGLYLWVWSIWLDGPYGALQGWDGLLVEPLDLGPMHYPADTRVRAYRGNLLFSPYDDAPAQDRRDGQLLEPNMSVEQNAAGEVLGIHDNEDIGVIDGFTLVP
ncbi:hypothetical protein [Ectopseudomonas alcaliphila]|uniref:hypothetical protein n=1 Tax=Ectopseudomonas alcaliphila TaxID=101564 RepID=UPI0027848FC9|nr:MULTISPECIES: hypothetical protein [Pseudomonas]MDP9939541.1 hypothetical protein [Pseudomonas sp. 3400]MDR7012892.1 hypothetical protein [Pseudomonas alcaliphila]